METAIQKKFLSLFAYIALTLLAALTLSQLIGYSQNTILNNGQWTVEKRMLTVGVMGADESLLGRQLVAGNTLNLGAWYGYQRLMSRKDFDPAVIRFRFKLSENAYFNLIFGNSGSAINGVRFSDYPALPSRIFYFDVKEQASALKAGPGLFQPGTWADAKVEFSGEELSLKINDKVIFREPSARRTLGKIGFWGGSRDVLIDDVEIVEKDGSIFTETFSNQKFKFRYFLIALTSLLLFNTFILVSAYILTNQTERLNYALQSGLIAVFTATLILGFSYGFDFQYWSRLPLSAKTRMLDGQKIPGFLSSLERLRYQLFESVADLGNDSLPLRTRIRSQGYPPNRIWNGPIYCVTHKKQIESECRVVSDTDDIIRSDKEGLRIMFSGSSQGIGAGASELKNTFYAQIHNKLARQHPRQRTLESLNIAVSGDRSDNQYEDYLSKYLEFKPDLMVLIWSNNDSEDSLKRGIRGFLAENKKRGISSILVLEANSPEEETIVTENHKALIELGQEFGVAVLNLHGHLKHPSVSSSDLQWYDIVHLTNLGQLEIANFLYPSISAHLP